MCLSFQELNRQLTSRAGLEYTFSREKKPCLLEDDISHLEPIPTQGFRSIKSLAESQFTLQPITVRLPHPHLMSTTLPSEVTTSFYISSHQLPLTWSTNYHITIISDQEKTSTKKGRFRMEVQKAKKYRQGARGLPKVKTGCQTCKCVSTLRSSRPLLNSR